jgi:hypothetical protein
MFLHLGWGGIYMDDQAAAAKIGKCFSMADRLVREAAVVGKLTANKRLTVVVSDFYGSYWTAPGQKQLVGGEELTTALKEATDWLVGYRQRAG